MQANEREYNEAEEKALRVCRIEFAPYPAGKYNKIASLEEGLGPKAAFDQARKDLPALASWSDLEIEATYTSLNSTPQELLIQSPLGPFLILSAISIWRDGLAVWNIPPCKDYLDFCPPGLQFPQF